MTFETDELGASTGRHPPLDRDDRAARRPGQLKVDAPEGTYTLSASGGDVAPAVVEVSTRRKSAQDELLLP